MEHPSTDRKQPNSYWTRMIVSTVIIALIIFAASRWLTIRMISPPSDIVLYGSSEFSQLLPLMVAKFIENTGYEGEFTIKTVDSTDGIKLFCRGDIDVLYTDREMTEDEIKACRWGWRRPVEFQIGAINRVDDNWVDLLYMYTTKRTVRSKPEVANFLDTYLEHVHEEFAGLDTKDEYFPRNETFLEEEKQLLEEIR
ncbi:MAG: substrate-binding domain-containing protein [Chloroflexota bacterium]